MKRTRKDNMVFEASWTDSFAQLSNLMFLNERNEYRNLNNEGKVIAHIDFAYSNTINSFLEKSR